MLREYKNTLDSIFEMKEVPSAGSVISNEEMDQYIKGGQASKDIKGKHSSTENSEYLRQIGHSIYVRKDNPFSTNDKDKTYWILKKSIATDASSGSGSGS